jgi:dTDP-4-amino-4,6-dideoxygalactose transaminase
VYHQFTIRIPKDRDRVRERLQELGVGTGIYYPIPVHKQPLYQDMGYSDRLPVSEQASQEVLSLPVHPSLTYDHLDVIAKAVKQAVKPKHWVKEATVDYAKPVAT